ncbi:MAG: DUF502 domain-containing protein [Candidatus Omnitrophica bacterium]|nr:DUF502 domain-containing protein [Candidatus Omnitrophota bacterium]
MKRKKKGILREVFGLLWRRIFAGMLVVVPFYVTYHVVRVLFLYIDGLSQPIIRPLVGHRVRGVGFLLTFLFLYGLGLIATNVFGRALLKSFENLLLRTPVVKNVYAAAKQVIETVSLPGKENFKKVVLVEYPRKGIFALGFVTGSTKGPDGKTLLNVFMSAPPNPATGNLIFVPEDEIVETDLSIEEAAKIIVSGGFLIPKEIGKG